MWVLNDCVEVEACASVSVRLSQVSNEPGSMELEEKWWRGQLAADIYQALRFKVSVGHDGLCDGCQNTSGEKVTMSSVFTTLPIC